jgi:hypothetical protein
MPMDDLRIHFPTPPIHTPQYSQQTNSVALHSALRQRSVRDARRRFLTLYYALGSVCLAMATFLNYSLLTGYSAAHRFSALLLLAISMAALIVSSTRYEKRHHAARELLRELPSRELE